MSSSATMGDLVGPEREKLLGKVRAVLGDVRAALAKAGATREDEVASRESVEQLDRLFLLVVVGEFNSGKSAFVNALLGDKVLEEGVTPTTSNIQIVEYAETIARETESDSIDRVGAPAPILKDLLLVDTPGTNAIERRHEAVTTHFIPRADAVLFITSADRPFTESERAFLTGVRDWGKKIVAVVNKADILADPADVEKVSRFVADGFQRLLGVETAVFPLSAKRALAAKRAGDSRGLAECGFAALEEHLRATLGEEQRFLLKLLNPIGVAARLTEKYGEAVEERLTVLAGDVAGVEQIEGQIAVYEKDLRRGFELRFADVDLILHQFEGRGHAFFDEMIRLGRVLDLLDKARVRDEFERLVVGDAPRRIESKVEEIIDWLIGGDLAQWKAVRDHFERRKSVHSDRVVGALNHGFEYDRTRLLDTVGKAAQRTLLDYDQAAEARRLAESARNAVASAALLEVGAVGLGAAISAAATSAAADVTGIAAAGVMAAIGLFVLPRRRRAAKKELRDKISELRTRLREALTTQFEKEIAHRRRRIEEAIEPYVRFVKAEQESLSARREEFEALRQTLSALQARLRRATSPVSSPG